MDEISRLAERMSETPEDQQRALLTVLDKEEGAYKPPVHIEEGPVFEEKPCAELIRSRRCKEQSEYSHFQSSFNIIAMLQ